MGDITLAMTKKFDGTLMAWARGAVQMLVPAGFRTPFTVIVNHAEDFVCRTDVCSKMKVTQGHKIYGPSFIYTYAGDGSAPPERFTVLSNPPWVPGNRATSKVVIDSYSDVRVKVIETGPAQKQ
jgi:hypothetical protein